MKKKILAIALIVVLIGIMVTGSLAYFTAQDEVTNTFTIGSVKIEIFENDKATDSDKLVFDKPLTPIVNVTDPAADVSYIGKKVEIKNTGANAAYIRTHIAVPHALIGYLYLDLEETGWTRQADSTATVENVTYDVFTFDYDAAVDSQNFTDALLKGVYLGSNVDLEENDNGDLVFILRENGQKTEDSGFVAHTKNADGSYTSTAVNVLVASQAIQAEGFTTATEALNSGFTANPWQ